MNKRPKSIVIIGLLFIATGLISLGHGVSQGARELSSQQNAEERRHSIVDTIHVSLSALFVLVGGAGIIRGHRWARWILVFWMAFHIVISIMHSMEKLIAHAVMFAPICYFLFRAKANAWFRSTAS